MTLRQKIESGSFALVLVVGLPALIFASQRIAG
jgi:hypothetical protein